MKISSRDYATKVEDVICAKLLDAVVSASREISEEFGRATGVDTSIGGFEDEGYYSGYLPEMRDLAIKWMEARGFDVEPDGASF